MAKKSDAPALEALTLEGDGEFSAAPEIFRDGKFSLVLEYLACDAVVLAEDEGRVVGFVLVGVANGRGMVGDLIVAKDKRGSGIGKALMDRGHALAKSRGAKNALVVIWADKGLEPFYESVGYKKIGHLMEAPL